MAAKPLTTEAVALTEKKMDMTLDDIIRMSKNTKTGKPGRVTNKSQKFSSGLTQHKSSKVQRYMESRSSLRQGILAKRRSSFRGNQFPAAAEIAQKTAVAPLRSKVFNHSRVVNLSKARPGNPASQRRAASGGFAAKHPLPFLQQQQEKEVNVMPKQRPQTLDSLFADLKEQRTKVSSTHDNFVQRTRGGNRMPPWGRVRFGN